MYRSSKIFLSFSFPNPTMYELLPPDMRALYSAYLIPSYLIILTILGEVGKQTTLLLCTQFYLATPHFISLRSEYSTQPRNLEHRLFTLLMRETKFVIPNTLYRCHRRNGPNFGRVFLMLNYTDITQNTYVPS